MVRLIDADDLMDWSETVPLTAEGGIDINDFEEKLKSMPTIDTKPHWIPCSERLPEYFETVITWDGHCYSVEKRIPFIRDEDGEPIKAEWWVSDDYEEETDYYPNLRDGAAIAWMPLPKPYSKTAGKEH